MAKRTIYVREEDQALFDQLAEEGNLSAVIARAVKSGYGNETETTLPGRRTRVRFLGGTPGPEIVVEEPPYHRLDIQEAQEPVAVYAKKGEVVPFSVAPEEKAKVWSLVDVDPICLQVSLSLVSLVDPSQGGLLLQRITEVRQKIARELGIVMPGVRCRDDPKLPPNTYTLSIQGTERARGEVDVNRLLAVGPSALMEKLAGTPAVDPTYGIPARSIDPSLKEEAAKLGLPVFDAVDLVATHLTDLIRQHAEELLGIQETHVLLENLRKTHPALVELTNFSLVQLWQIFRGLLREGVSIRDRVTILESLLVMPGELTVEHGIEAARRALGRWICREYTDNKNQLSVYELSPASVETLEAGQTLPLPESDRSKVVVTAPPLRRRLREQNPHLVVLSKAEIPKEIKLIRLGLL